MTHYSNDPEMVRVDYFRPSGKWYMTEAHDMSAHYHDIDIYQAVKDMLVEADRWLPHYTIVVMEPYHRNPYPVMIVAEGTTRTKEDSEREAGLLR